MNFLEWDKIERYFEGKFTEEDEKYVIDIFEDRNKSAILKSALSKQWKEFLQNDDTPEKNLDHVLHKIHYSINTRKEFKDKTFLHKFGAWYYRVAAVLLIPLIVTGAILLNQLIAPSEGDSITSWAEIHSTMGSRVSFNLPDGSTGWLNSGSVMKYQMDFNKNRLVVLDGEAYFDVVKSKNPFYVKTSDIKIKVLGTKFNVKSYSSDNIVETTLLTGMVEIETITPKSGTPRKLVLMPNQKATFNKHSGEIKNTDQTNTSEKQLAIKEIGIFEDIDTSPITAWKDDKLIFINEPFESLIVKLERWYDVQITLKDSSLINLSYTGKFENETVEQAFNAIKLATPNIGYTIRKNNIDIFLKRK